MKTASKLAVFVALFLSTGLLSFNYDSPKTSYSFPFKKAGLTERQAAAHLLSRFTFGAKPGDVDAVVNMGLEKWFQQQLQGNLSDSDVTKRLTDYDALGLSNEEILKTYPRPGDVLKMAEKDGFISKDSLDGENKKEYREKLQPYYKLKGFKPQKELLRQFVNQKIIRAAYSNNQLQEVLADFWFNHFNIAASKRGCAEFLPAYERDVIRPNVTGKFENLLVATAKSPAMLVYLDNFISAGENPQMNIGDNEKFRRRMEKMIGKDTSTKAVLNNFAQQRKKSGLNENYAREVMELHTLGVDGGYTQQDVTQAAKVLSGWTIYPMGDFPQAKVLRKLIDNVGEQNLASRGFVHEGDFLFAANRHDTQEKMVLGKTFRPGGGYEEGKELLKMLAHHPSTAKFICRKLAVKFVNDEPSQVLVDNMAKTFLEKDGDIKQVLLTMVSSPEFWNSAAIREKTKSPFELVISSVRTLNADVQRPYQLYQWIDKMGQKLYYYQAPTGFPDKGQYWINTGSLLNRMNFGLALAAQRIPGVQVNLLALNKGHEPESAEAALETYLRLVMPERDVATTAKRLTPLLHDPELEKKLNEAATDKPATSQPKMSMMQDDDNLLGDDEEGGGKNKKGKKDFAAMHTGDAANKNMLSQVVGIIIGSPEFQRR